MLDLPDLDAWLALDRAEQVRVAELILSALDDGWALVGVAPTECGEMSGWVAEYIAPDGARFNLVPGGTATVGFEASTWTPSAAEVAVFEAADWVRPYTTLQELLDATTTERRTVRIEPHLVEVVASPPWLPVSTLDPEKDAALGLDIALPAEVGLASTQRALNYYIHRGPDMAGLRSSSPDGPGAFVEIEPHHVVRGPNGIEVRRRPGATYAEVVAAVEADGWHLPTPDTWEYFCGGGSDKLFRWGDRILKDDGSFAHALDAPNGFGLVIGHNSWACEILSPAGQTRGGDGGASDSYGVGPLGVTLAASSYFAEFGAGSFRGENSGLLRHDKLRRVLPLT